MDKHEKSVYLTFDDGPIPEATPFILDTLAEFGIHATFFMVGDNVRKYPELYRRVVEEGHRIGNHTFHHMGGFRHTVKTYNADAEQADKLLHTDLFRPPHGWMRLDQYIWLGRKYRIVMWDRAAETAEKYIRKGTKLYIEGRLRTRVWEDRNTIKRSVTEIYVDNFDILSRPSAQ